MKIGLLPLYVKLYDDKLPELRVRLEKFYGEIAKMFEERDVTVVTADFCRVSRIWIDNQHSGRSIDSTVNHILYLTVQNRSVRF